MWLGSEEWEHMSSIHSHTFCVHGLNQPWNKNIFKCICTEYGQTYFLPLSHKQYNIRTVNTVLGIISNLNYLKYTALQRFYAHIKPSYIRTWAPPISVSVGDLGTSRYQETIEYSI
jgi:hypothetical protein